MVVVVNFFYIYIRVAFLGQAFFFVFGEISTHTHTQREQGVREGV